MILFKPSSVFVCLQHLNHPPKKRKFLSVTRDEMSDITSKYTKMTFSSRQFHFFHAHPFFGLLSCQFYLIFLYDLALLGKLCKKYERK